MTALSGLLPVLQVRKSRLVQVLTFGVKAHSFQLLHFLLALVEGVQIEHHSNLGGKKALYTNLQGI